MASIAFGRATRDKTARPTTMKDRFLDIVVMISFVIFLLLAAGVGILAIQMSL